MSNSLSAAKPYIWGKKMQSFRQKKQVAIAVANSELRDDLKMGVRAYKPYPNYLTDAAYTKGTDVSPQDINVTEEYLEVDTARTVPFYYDDLDRVQDKWDQDTIHANAAMQILNNKIDGSLQAQYSNAADTLDDGELHIAVDKLGYMLEQLVKSLVLVPSGAVKI